MNYKDFITALADTSYADWYVDVGGELRIACDEDPTADAEDPIAAVCNDMLGTDYNSRNAWFWAARELGLSAKDVEAICDAADGKRGEVRDDMLEALGLGGADMNYYDFIALLAEASYADWNVADYDSSGGWRGAALKLGLSFNDVEAICVDAIGGDGEVRDDLLRALGLGERT